MSDVAIRVDNLGKEYRIGTQQASYRTIRETMVDAFQAPVRRAGKLLRGQATSAAELNETIWALKDVSFEIKQGDVVGVIGRNGAGKSTLLKILSRITEPTTGRVEIHGRVGSLLEVGTGFHPELTGRENIYLNGAILGMSRNDIQRQFDEIVAFAEVERFIDTPVKHYSSGMYLRLAFAVAAHLEPEILLVDEVLAVGDAAFQKKCLGKMGDVANEGRTVLFVSHNMTAVQQLCNLGIVLVDGSVETRSSIDSAVRSYLQSMLTATENTDLSMRSDRKGNRRLQFTRIAISDVEGNELRQVISGQSVILRFYYVSEIEKQDASVLVAFNVASSRGNLIANLNTEDTGQTQTDIKAQGYFECHWPKFNLRSGRYDCSLFCSVNGEIADWMQNAFTIDVEDGDYYGTGKLIAGDQGDILIDHRWTAG